MNRRSFLRGAGSLLVAAPAIVRAEALMPLRGIILPEAAPLIVPGTRQIWAIPYGDWRKFDQRMPEWAPQPLGVVLRPEPPKPSVVLVSADGITWQLPTAEP